VRRRRCVAPAGRGGPGPQPGGGYARALAATGPAYEAIQHVGEAAFIEAATAAAAPQVRDGLPVRAQIAVVGYLARKPEES
jgi:hypothetical protein